MIDRDAIQAVEAALARQAAVALLGPRQVGKTTLALKIAEERLSVYLDLEDPADRAKLGDPAAYFASQGGKLIILDEIHRAPELFATLRGIIDAGRRRGDRTGRFLILGSASIDLLKQSSESLAGRIAYVRMGVVHALEAGRASIAVPNLWLRGGFPDALLEGSEADSLALRKDFIQTYLQRDVKVFGPNIPAETLERLWTMLAHQQGATLNASKLAGNIMVSAPTVHRYIDLLVDLLLVRRLPPYTPNVSKRLVKSPKLYVRDSGLVHALLGIETYDALAGHPVVGGSWEGFVIENLLSVTPPPLQASFYRTQVGAEIDLVLDTPGGELWAVEIKRGGVPKTERGFHHAREDLDPARAFVVYGGDERYPLKDGVEAIGLAELMREVRGSDT